MTFTNVPHIDDGRTIFWGISHSSAVTDVLDGLVKLYHLPAISAEYTVEAGGKHQGRRTSSILSSVVETFAVLRPLDPLTPLVDALC